MDDILLGIYQSHNDAAINGVMKVAEQIGEEHGPEGVELFEKWLDQVPAEEIFDLEGDPEKTAEDLDEQDREKLAEYDLAGRVMAHALMDEMGKQEKIADYVADHVRDAFLSDCG